MTMTDFDWELACFAPTFLVWCVAIYFCFVRRRENPRGATFLGLAILVAFAQVVFSSLFVYFLMTHSSSGSDGMKMMPYLGYPMMVGVTVGNAVKWILVTLAVFAQRPHYDFTDELMFNDEQA